LQRSVESALAQTYKNFEICISQNPKANGPDLKIKEWCEAKALSGQIRYSLNKQNLGLSGNLNALANMANGDYVIFIGDDDLLHKHFLQTLAVGINDKTGVIFCNQYFINEKGNVLDKTTLLLNKDYGRTALKEGLIDDTVGTVFKNAVPLSASLIKRDLVIKHPFPVEVNTPELPLFLKIALEGYDFYYENKQLAYYRLHSNSETSKGLTIDKLLKTIIEIDVPESSVNSKDLFIRSRIIPAINSSLKKGDKSLAAFLLKSKFYPDNNAIKKIIQRIFLLMPRRINKRIFNIFVLIKDL
jgi:glycosyltransferase involved in cell wall biosynthesis